MFTYASKTSFRTLLVLVAGLIALMLLQSNWTRAREVDPPRPAPELTQHDDSAWINSPPLTLEQLRGQVVLVDFWAFGCWNCYRSFPWLKALEERYNSQGLMVLGVHTPEFEREKERSRVVTKVKEFGLPHPVMMDNDYSYWNAMGNRYWPTYYLVDKRGLIRAYFVGETHAGDRRAKAIEAKVKELLEEPAA